MARNNSSAAKEKFEEVLARLETQVHDLEGGRLTLDEALGRYEEGVKALKKCYEILRDAEKRVELLLRSEDGVLKTVPFEAPAEEAAAANGSEEG